MTDETREKLIRIDERICETKSGISAVLETLSQSTSGIGDWKIIKCYEAKLQGLESPYDLDALMAERQAARDKINELQETLNTLETEKAELEKLSED